MNPVDTEQALRVLVAQVSRRNLPPIGRDADLVRELGLDSLSALRLLALVEKRFETRFPDTRLSEFRTLGTILDWIERDEREEHAGETRSQ